MKTASRKILYPLLAGFFWLGCNPKSSEDDEKKSTPASESTEPDPEDDNSSVTIAVPMGLIRDGYLHSYLRSTTSVLGFQKYSEALKNPPNFKSSDFKAILADFTLESIKQNNILLGMVKNLLDEVFTTNTELEAKLIPWETAITHAFETQPKFLATSVTKIDFFATRTGDKSVIDIALYFANSTSGKADFSIKITNVKTGVGDETTRNFEGSLLSQASIVEGFNLVKISNFTFSIDDNKKNIITKIIPDASTIKNMSFSEKYLNSTLLPSGHLSLSLAVRVANEKDRIAMAAANGINDTSMLVRYDEDPEENGFMVLEGARASEFPVI